MFAGEKHRERVVTPEEEARLSGSCPRTALVHCHRFIDTRMRPDECFRLRLESIMWVNGRYGTLFVTDGKTTAARRVLPMTPRVRGILTLRQLSGYVYRDVAVEETSPVLGLFFPFDNRTTARLPSRLFLSVPALGQ
jgi:integrase